MTSLLRPRDNNIAALVTGVGVIICLGIGMPVLGIGWAAVIGGLYFVFVVGGTMWCFMRLQSVDTRHDK